MNFRLYIFNTVILLLGIFFPLSGSSQSARLFSLNRDGSYCEWTELYPGIKAELSVYLNRDSATIRGTQIDIKCDSVSFKEIGNNLFIADASRIGTFKVIILEKQKVIDSILLVVKEMPFRFIISNDQIMHYPMTELTPFHLQGLWVSVNCICCSYKLSENFQVESYSLKLVRHDSTIYSHDFHRNKSISKTIQDSLNKLYKPDDKLVAANIIVRSLNGQKWKIESYTLWVIHNK